MQHNKYVKYEERREKKGGETSSLTCLPIPPHFRHASLPRMRAHTGR
jgi:hypothetical protein